MIVDTSAVMAILLGEPDTRKFATAMIDAPNCTISAGSWIELSAVLTRGRHDLDAALNDLVVRSQLKIAPVTVDQARIGHDAYRTYGRGSGHSARLNFGDCFAYALARASGESLLFKGEDFARTDVIAAV